MYGAIGTDNEQSQSPAFTIHEPHFRNKRDGRFCGSRAEFLMRTPLFMLEHV